MEPNQNANPDTQATPEQTPPVDGAQAQNPAVTQSSVAPANPAPADVDPTGGVEDGVVEKTNEKLPVEVRDRIDQEEKVVHEKDDQGNVIGFHKVPADGSTPPEQDTVLKPGQEDPEAEAAAAKQATGGNQ